MDIDVAKLARARAVLGTATDTETVDQALDLVSFRHEHAAALERLAAAGGLVDGFGREAAPAAAPGRVEGDDRVVRRKAGRARS
ncbi:hypothetical protein tb265_14450 [Gemmatimonadetes bacterium T265]|nr:hypothetical protein tb265_14450 [Gemmatimonadetes bacterium T265]